MDKLIDYVRWMADFPISATGLRDADALVLCALSYFDWSCVLTNASEQRRLSDCRRMLEDAEAKVMITGSVQGYPELLNEAVGSRRFGDLVLSNYEDITRKDPPIQFSAICFSADPDISFLAFRGTDNSLTGWKEDFMISFTRTEAQLEALRCADACVKPGRKWYLGGHSKGGYLALYAGCMLEDERLRSVEQIYMLDGPGFCPDVLDTGLLKRVDGRTRRVIPGYSVVGKLFEPELSNTVIVSSDEKGFLQHSLISWEIDHGKLAVLESNDPESVHLNKVIDGWISDMPREDRTVFINELFEALGAGGAETISAISEGGASGILTILRKLLDSGSVTKNALFDFVKKYMARAKPDDARRKHSEEKEAPADPENEDDARRTLAEGAK